MRPFSYSRWPFDPLFGHTRSTKARKPYLKKPSRLARCQRLALSATFRAASGSLANFVFAISGLDGGALERLLPVQVVGEKVSPSQDCNAIAPPQPRQPPIQRHRCFFFAPIFHTEEATGFNFLQAVALKSEKGKLSLVGLGVRSAWTGEHRRPVMLRFNGQGGRSMALAAA